MTHGRSMAAVLLVLLVAPLSLADTFEWTTATSGNFADAGNWTNTTGSDLPPPNIGDTALFNEAMPAYTVTLTADAALDVLDVDAGTITFDSSGGTHTYDLGTGDADATFVGSDITLDQTNLIAGDDFILTNGTMQVLVGSHIKAADVTSIATSSGDADLTFDGSTFDFGGLVRMGLSGFDATLTLQNSSMGNIAGDLDFARSGTLGSGGFLNVESASTLTTNGRILLGDILSNGAPNYNTFITVDDGTFTMNGANNLRVGDSMFDNVNAELRVENNGVFSTGIGGGNTVVQRTGLLALETEGEFHARNDLLVTQGAQITATTEALLDTQQLFAIQSGSSVTLDGEADLMAANIEIGIDDSNAMLSLSGNGTTGMQSGSSTLQIGGAGTAAATLLLTGNAEFTTGTGATTIGDTGTLDIEGATFNANGSLTMSGGATLTLNGGALNANAGLDNSAGGTLEHFDGTLTVTGGAFLPNAGGPADDYVIDGPTPMETPHLVVGAGATENIGDDLFVGRVNRGELTFTGGGMVSNEFGIIGRSTGSTGTATVDGAGSTWTNSGSLTVGDSGTGTLNITGGGEVSNSTGIIGSGSDSTGTVTVDGSDVSGNPSTWMNTSDLRVSDRGTGTLTIQNGGAVSSSDGFIGESAGSTGMVTVDGSDASGNVSTWTNDGGLLVGRLGTGTLNITGGGLVTNTDGSIGTFSVSTSTVAVSDTDAMGNASTWTNTADLYVGGSDAGAGGNGSLTVEAGGHVGVDGTMKIWNTGTVNLEGGSITAQTIDDTDGGTFSLTGGVLHVETYSGNLTNAGGTLAPGNSAGGTTIIGDLTQQAGATLQFEIGGELQVTHYDFITVTGTTLLDGILELALINDFVPDAANTFTLLSAGNLAGLFDNVASGGRLDTTGGGGSFEVTIDFGSDQIVLSNFLMAGLPGDYNGNGTVDAADYTVWRDLLGQVGIGLAADGTGPGGAPDGVVDGLDYQFWVDNFGNTAGSGSASHLAPGDSPGANYAVPEPAALSLALLIVVGLVALRPARRHKMQ